jgi:hypothetical protein
MRVLTPNALPDWCRFSQAGASYIEPGSPWQNPYVESFGGWLRDELLADELLALLNTKTSKLPAWMAPRARMLRGCTPRPATLT